MCTGNFWKFLIMSGIINLFIWIALNVFQWKLIVIGIGIYREQNSKPHYSWFNGNVLSTYKFVKFAGLLAHIHLFAFPLSNVHTFSNQAEPTKGDQCSMKFVYLLIFWNIIQKLNYFLWQNILFKQIFIWTSLSSSSWSSSRMIVILCAMSTRIIREMRINGNCWSIFICISILLFYSYFHLLKKNCVIFQSAHPLV